MAIKKNKKSKTKKNKNKNLSNNTNRFAQKNAMNSVVKQMNFEQTKMSDDAIFYVHNKHE